MNIEIKYRPSFAALFVTLAPGESIRAESDAMASMTSKIDIHTRLNGGFFTAICRRIFGGESIFINEFHCKATQDPEQLVLTQPVPGDIEEVDLNGNTLYLQPGAYVASETSVALSLGWAGLASWFSREGLFRLKVSGYGKVWFGGYGGVYERPVDSEYMVDTGHLLAYEPTLSFGIALSGGIFSSFFGGEGFVARLRGQGKVYMQSRSMGSLAGWTNRHLW